VLYELDHFFEIDFFVTLTKPRRLVCPRAGALAFFFLEHFFGRRGRLLPLEQIDGWWLWWCSVDDKAASSNLLDLPFSS
jgi:hypothetical protein